MAWSSRGDRVDVDPLPVGAADLGERVRHRGLHADAEHVQLDHPGDLRVVLVELAEREALAALLHRGPVEQGPIGQQHAARVHGDVPRQAVELLR